MVQVCPICKRPLSADQVSGPYRPFCSQRCKTIDLGDWLDGAYRISAPVAEEDLDEGGPQGALLESSRDQEKSN
jgi:uncharacterized protein